MSHPRTIRAVVFDLDDMLFPERDYVRSGYRAVSVYLRQRLGRRDDFDAWLWDRFCAGQAAGAFDAMNEHFGLKLTPADIARLVEVYRCHVPAIRPFDDIPPLLASLRPRFALALLSDGFLPAQRLKLRALGLEDAFHPILFTEEIGREAWKPSPIGFERMRDSLNVPHECCAYVGDNPSKDFLAPNRLGWRSIQWLREGQIHSGKPAPEGGRPGAIVRGAAELLAALG